MNFSKKCILFFTLFFVGGGYSWVQCRPTTDVVVSKPKGSVTVVKPMSRVVTTKPGTTVQSAEHPSTSTGNVKPKTSVAVTHQSTDVVVTHPTSDNIVVTHPTTNVVVSHAGENIPSANANDAKPSSTSNSSTTSMASSYKPPVAKDFKATQLGSGESGLGQPNEAEKSAAAASFKLPKPPEANEQGLDKAAKSVNLGNMKSKIEKKVNQKGK